MLNNQKVFLLIVLLTGLLLSENIKEGFNQFRAKLIHTELTPYECQRRCVIKPNCRYSNYKRNIDRTQKKGECYHSYGLKGQYSVNGGNDTWITMYNKNFIPKNTQTESWKIDQDCSSYSCNKTVYKQLPEGALATKLFYKFSGKDQGWGNPTRVPHLAVKDDKGGWHDVYDNGKKGSHNNQAQGSDRTMARGSMQNHNAMRSFKIPVKLGKGNNVRVEYPSQGGGSGHTIMAKKSKFSVEFRD